MKSCKSVHNSLNSPLAVLLKGMMRALGSDLLFPLVPAAGSKSEELAELNPVLFPAI